MRPIAITLAVGALAAATTPARAQSSHISIELSTDNQQTWHAHVDVVPATQVIFRIRMQLLNPATNILGFGGMTYQPTFSNWHSELDSAPDVSGQPRDFPPYDLNGRTFPFSSASQGSSSASGQITTFNDPGNILRIAGAYCTTMTTNVAWGVISNQLTQQLAGTYFMPGTNITIFKSAFTVGDTGAERTLIADIPVAGILNARATWFVNSSGTDSFLDTLTADNISPAEIHVLPAPSVGFVILALAPRRRRCRP